MQSADPFPSPAGPPLADAELLLCQGMVATASALLDADAAVVWLRDAADPGLLRAAAACGLPSSAAGGNATVAVGSGYAGLAVSSGLPQAGPVRAGAGQDPVLSEGGLLEALAVPLPAFGGPAGALVVGWRDRSDSPPDASGTLAAFASRAAPALAELRDAAAGAGREKDLQLAMVGHELKTPLTVILGTLQTLQARAADLAPEVRDELVGTALLRGRDLSRLLDALLEGSRAELAAAVEDLSLPELVDRATAGFGSAAELLVDPAPAVRVRVDAAAVVSAVGVLLENAVSHGDGGAVRVRASVEGTGAGGPDVALRVSNPGRLPEGLDPAQLLVPFRRGERAATPGVGLGLAVAARLAGALGGRLTAACADGEVTFTLRFPAGTRHGSAPSNALPSREHRR